ncbi:hypothetical protein MNBD_ALPHA11-946 [hydrothermal vent metagenome]|uniref:Uncharacterized protein n=1 Tax=hydrothermal vent metagenome TaxID=652676 RepID=A0A3B0U8S3_9ZZZZ
MWLWAAESFLSRFGSGYGWGVNRVLMMMICLKNNLHDHYTGFAVGRCSLA